MYHTSYIYILSYIFKAWIISLDNSMVIYDVYVHA